MTNQILSFNSSFTPPPSPRRPSSRPSSVIDALMTPSSAEKARRNCEALQAKLLVDRIANLPGSVKWYRPSAWRSVRDAMGGVVALYHQGEAFLNPSLNLEPTLQTRVTSLQNELAEMRKGLGGGDFEKAAEIALVIEAVQALRTRGKDIGATTVEVVLKSLAKENQLMKRSWSFAYVLRLMQGGLQLYDFPPLGRGLLIIPVRLAKPSEGHMVAFIINGITNVIEYYDPEGLTLQDRKDVPLYSGPSSREFREEKKLWFLFLELRDKYGCTQVAENPHKHQWDFYSGALLVCDFFKRREEGERFNWISNTGHSQNALHSSVRWGLIELLLKHIEE